MKRYMFVEIEGDPNAHEWLRAILAHEPVRTADITDLLAYNRSTPGDPWDKPYPAMYAEMVERLS
jgi:hypothetical protein